MKEVDYYILCEEESCIGPRVMYKVDGTEVVRHSEAVPSGIITMNEIVAKKYLIRGKHDIGTRSYIHAKILLEDEEDLEKYWLSKKPTFVEHIVCDYV